MAQFLRSKNRQIQTQNSIYKLLNNFRTMVLNIKVWRLNISSISSTLHNVKKNQRIWRNLCVQSLWNHWPCGSTALKTGIEITARAEEQFQKSFSVNTVCCAIHKCRLKLQQDPQPPSSLRSGLRQSGELICVQTNLFGKHGEQVLSKKERDHSASLMVRGCLIFYWIGSWHYWKMLKCIYRF